MYEVTGNRAVLLNGVGDELITLNAAGTLVWIALAEPGSKDQVVERLRQRYDGIPADRLAQDVELFLDELLASELVVADADG